MYLLGILIIIGISTASSSVIDGDCKSNNDRHLTNANQTMDANKKDEKNELKITEILSKLEYKFEQEISKLKLQNEDQNEEIQILKAARTNQTKRLRDVENEINELKVKNDEKTIKIQQLEKMIEDQNKMVSEGLAENKSGTLVSASSGKEDNSVTSKLPDQLPTSCNDLLSNGNRLNGIYSMFDPKTKMVIMAFCDFKNGGKGSKRLGLLNVKSSIGVYFYVQRNSMPDDTTPKTIRFNNQRLNIGNAMDMSTGVFTAPTPGIYQFSFSMTKDGWTTGELFVYLRLNSKHIGLAISSSGFYSGLASFQSILSLKKGDRIDLYKSQGKINIDAINICHFTGLLLEDNFSHYI